MKNVKLIDNIISYTNIFEFWLYSPKNDNIFLNLENIEVINTKVHLSEDDT